MSPVKKVKIKWAYLQVNHFQKGPCALQFNETINNSNYRHVEFQFKLFVKDDKQKINFRNW